LQEPSEEKRTQKNFEPRTEVPSANSAYGSLVAASPLTSQWTPPYFAV